MAELNMADGDVLAGADTDEIDTQMTIICTSGTRPTGAEGRRIYETDTNRLYYYDGSAWVIETEPLQTWSPTITQSSSVAGTVNRGWYQRRNGLWEAALKWTSSASGTAANAIVVSTPLTTVNAADTGGSFRVYDASATTSYAGYVLGFTTTSVQLYCDAATSALGINPALTLATSDEIWLHIAGSY